MAVSAVYLGDTSVISRINKPPVAQRLFPLIERGLVATCALLDLEAGYAAKDGSQYKQLITDRAALYPWVPMPDNVFEQAQDIQVSLLHFGTHRGVGIPDLLIAVTARANDLTILHYDHDFDLISQVVGVRTEWVVPPGTAGL